MLVSTMADFDYTAPADLLAGTRPGRGAPLSYRHFDSAAQAIRYAVEKLPPQVLVATVLEVDEDRYSAKQIQALYDNPHYPLPKRS
jgi:hypothetical protein